MKSLISILSAVLLLTINAEAQLSPAEYSTIDSLFIDWNRPNHPGGSIGVMKDGKVVFSKAYGLASLDFLVPNSTETIYNTASVSKQFTAMGIVVLDVQGELSVDDDIRKHIPELPEFDYPITIRHMLHHTSGLRSLHALLELAGWRDDDARTNEDLYRFMKNQRDLNFRPGEEYLYCNTGYILMSKIIENVTDEKFTDWMKANVFEPLGMINTYVEDQYNRVVPGNAASYNGSYDRGFSRATEYWGYVGSGNMHSTTNDLLKWLVNFYDPQSGWEEQFEMLQTLDKFNNGEENTYAFGVGINKVFGQNRISHGGAIGGYRSFICTYPDQKLNIAILTNFSSSSVGQKVNEISKMLLGMEDSDEAEGFDASSAKVVKLSKKELQKYEASYWNDESTYARKIYLKDDTLRYFRSENSESPLVPIGKNEFQMLGVDVDLKVRFQVGEDGDKTMIVTIDGGEPIISNEFEMPEASAEYLSNYTGEFYSPELETSYIISIQKDKLVGHHSRHGDFDIKMLKEDILEGQWPFNIAKVKRDDDGAVSGLRVSNGRVRDLWFEKR